MRESAALAHAAILSGKTYTAPSYAEEFGLAEAAAQEELDWLCSLERETEAKDSYGVDRVSVDGREVYRRVVVDSKLLTVDMRGVADVQITDKVMFYIGMALGEWQVEERADTSFNLTASHSGPEENGLKMGLRRQRGEESIALVGAGVRLSSARLKRALVLGLRAAGVRVYDLGTTDTPLTYHALSYFEQPDLRPLPEDLPNPQGKNHFSRVWSNPERQAAYARIPTRERPANLARLQASLRLRGAELAAYERLERDSDLAALRQGASVDDNAMARHHRTMVESRVRLGPEISQYLFNDWVYGQNRYRELVDRLERMSDADWDALADPSRWRTFSSELRLPRHKFPAPPPTAQSRLFDAEPIITDFACGSMFRMTELLDRLGFVTRSIAQGEHDSALPDGHFPIHPPDPTKPQNRQLATQRSEQAGAIAVLFDEDGDRFQVIVQGQAITGPEMAALMAPYVPGRIVLTDVGYPEHVNDALKKAGKLVYEGPVGNAFFVASAEAIRRALREGRDEVVLYPDHVPTRVDLQAHRASLEAGGMTDPEDQARALEVAMAIEGSCHGFFPANGYANDGPFYLAEFLAYLAEIREPEVTAAAALARRYQALEKHPSSPAETRIAMDFRVPNEQKQELVVKILDAMESEPGRAWLEAIFGEPVRLELGRMDGGKIRVYGAGGEWLGSALFRKSNNEPLFSGNFAGQTHAHKQRLEEWVAVMVASTTVEVEEAGKKRQLGAVFTSPHTAPYLRQESRENDEPLSDGTVKVHPPLLDRLWLNASLADRLSADARARLGLVPRVETAPIRERERVRRAHAAIRDGRSFTVPSYARSVRASPEQARAELDWLAELERELEPNAEFFGVDRVGSSRDEAYRRVSVDPRLWGDMDMRGPAELWTDKAVFYAGLAYGQWLVLNRHDGAFNISASHNGAEDNGIKPSLRWQRGEHPIALVGAGVRLSSPRIKAHFMLGLRAAGVEVYDLGTVHTPLIYHALAYFREPRQARQTPAGRNHFSGVLSSEQCRQIYRWMPTLEENANLDALRQWWHAERGGELAGYAALERDSDLVALQGGGEITEDNAMARRHAAMVESLVRLGPEISQHLFHHWVYAENDYQHLVDRLGRMSRADWCALGQAEEWQRFAEELDLPLGKYPAAPETATVSEPFGDVPLGIDLGNGSMWRIVLLLRRLGFRVRSVQTEQHDSSRPDGHFPIHVPDPTNAKYQEQALALSRENGGQIVLMFDEDGDRFQVLVAGRVLSGIDMAVLLSAVLPGRVVLTDVRYWQYANEALERAGKTVFEGPVGYAFYGEAAEALRRALGEGEPEVTLYPQHQRRVVNLAEMRQELAARGVTDAGDQNLALGVAMGIEGSGHAFFPANGYANDGSFYLGMFLWYLTQIPREPGETATGALVRHYDGIRKNPASPSELRIALDFLAPTRVREELVQKILEAMESEDGRARLARIFAEPVELVIRRGDGGRIHVRAAGGEWLASALLRKANTGAAFGTNFEGRTHADKHRLEEWLVSQVASTTLEVLDGAETRPLGADFARSGTSSYFRTQTADNDEQLPSGDVIHHPPIIERIRSDPRIMGTLSEDARRRIGFV
jgi:phosphomannomutase